jgi:hypothetical protein
LKDAQQRKPAGQTRPFLNIVTRAFRLPPDLLETVSERVLATVAIAFVLAVLVDAMVRGL